jgi:hypothetical protein
MEITFVFGYRFTLETAKKLFPEYFTSGDPTDEIPQFEKVAEAIKKAPGVHALQFNDGDEVTFAFGVAKGGFELGTDTLFDVPRAKSKDATLLDKFVELNPLFSSLKRSIMLFCGD